MYSIYLEGISEVDSVWSLGLAKADTLKATVTKAQVDLCHVVMSGELCDVKFKAELNRINDEYTGEIRIRLPKSDDSELKIMALKRALNIEQCEHRIQVRNI